MCAHLTHCPNNFPSSSSFCILEIPSLLYNNPLSGLPGRSAVPCSTMPPSPNPIHSLDTFRHHSQTYIPASSATILTTSHLCSECRFPEPTLPLVSKWKDMIGTAFSLAIVSYVINLAMGRTLAAKHGYDVDPNQVTLALERCRNVPLALRRERKTLLHEWEACKCTWLLKMYVLLPRTWQPARQGPKGHGRSISYRWERHCQREEKT